MKRIGAQNSAYRKPFLSEARTGGKRHYSKQPLRYAAGIIASAYPLYIVQYFRPKFNRIWYKICYWFIADNCAISQCSGGSVVQVVIGKAAHTAYIGGGVLILAHHKTFAALGRKLHENFESGGVLRHSHRKPQGNIAAAGGSFSAHKNSPPAMYLWKYYPPKNKFYAWKKLTLRR